MNEAVIHVHRGGPVVALVGNPNCGKTALFNRLTGSRQKVANYAGVTVERKEGPHLTAGRQGLRLLDLPGAYSLHPRVARRAITATCCTAGRRREAARSGAVRGRRHEPAPQPAPRAGGEAAGPAVRRRAQHGRPGARGRASRIDARALAPSSACRWSTHRGGRKRERRRCAAARCCADSQAWRRRRRAGSRAGAGRRDGHSARGARASCRAVARPTWPPAPPATASTASCCIRSSGRCCWPSLLFLDVPGGVQLGRSADGRDRGRHRAGSARCVGDVLPEGRLRSLLVDGIIAGVGGVLVFLPQILILFFFILVLEESGYLPRAAFLLDRLMGGVGCRAAPSSRCCRASPARSPASWRRARSPTRATGW